MGVVHEVDLGQLWVLEPIFHNQLKPNNNLSEN